MEDIARFWECGILIPVLSRTAGQHLSALEVSSQKEVPYMILNLE